METFTSVDQPIVFPIMIRIGKILICVCHTIGDLPKDQPFTILEVSTEEVASESSAPMS